MINPLPPSELIISKPDGSITKTLRNPVKNYRQEVL